MKYKFIKNLNRSWPRETIANYENIKYLFVVETYCGLTWIFILSHSTTFPKMTKWYQVITTIKNPIIIVTFTVIITFTEITKILEYLA